MVHHGNCPIANGLTHQIPNRHWHTEARHYIIHSSGLLTAAHTLRPNGFEVVSRDGKTKVCVRCDETQGDLNDWLTSISAFITKHSQEEVTFEPYRIQL